MSQFTFTIIFLALITAGFLAWFFSHKTREKERLMLIENGIDIPQLESGLKFTFRFPWLKIGVLVTAIGIGILSGAMIEEFTSTRIDFIPILMLLFGGIGMILAHFLGKESN